MQESSALEHSAAVARPGQSTLEPLDFAALGEYLAERLIYVVGNARGGSTFTNSAIGIHPKVLCVGWNNVVFGRLLSQLESLEPAELRRKMLRPETGKHYDESVALRHIGAANFAAWNAYVNQVCRSRDLRQLVCLQGLLYWIMRPTTADLRDCSAWCIKENSWAGTELLKRIMPKTRVVFVQRDPRSTALSFAKVYARAREEHFNDGDITRAALDWLRNAVEFARGLDRDSDALLLYFERLLADPPTILNRLWRHLGLKPLEIPAVEAGLAKIEYTTTKTHEERGRVVNSSGLHTAALTRWQTQLSPQQIANICTLTQSGARHFGYRFDPKPTLRDLVSALRAAGTGSVRALAVYLYCRARLLFTPKAKQVTQSSRL
jgi:hypothetical protein